MKKVLMGIGIALSVGAMIWYFVIRPSPTTPIRFLSPVPSPDPSATRSAVVVTPDPTIPRVTVAAENLDTPWSIAFLPDSTLLIAERNGAIKRLRTIPGSPELVHTVPSAREAGEGGLLGMALHPQFSTTPWVYLYYTYRNDGEATMNRVVRIRYEKEQFGQEETLIDKIPGASNHNGGRIAFGPDGYLYVTTGDSQEPSLSQDRASLAGKILRVTDTGESAPGNPFNSAVYSYGHRNPQGLTWDSTGRLWSTEHGRSGIQSGLDELNLIESGGNYGWPETQGDETREGMISPLAHSGEDATWAPASAAYSNGSVFFGGLRGRTLYEIVLNGAQITEHLQGEYGRIREVVTGPDAMLYISTSNKDGRGIPGSGDDKILRVNPAQLQGT